MKALIMANVGEGHFYHNEMIPACFLPLYNDMTIIDRQISLLNINGFCRDDICVLCGQNGIWDTEFVRKKIRNLDAHIIYTPKNNLLKKNIFADEFFAGNDVYIIEGNRVLDIAIISRLRRYREKNVIVIKDMLTPDEESKMVSIKNGSVIAFKDSDLKDFPWIAFAGIARFSQEAVQCLKKTVLCPRPLLDAVEDILPECELKTISYDDLVYGKLNGGHSDELTGGSYSKLNYRLIVKKESNGEGRDKLINEIKWLLDVPADLKPYFSQILEYDIDSEKVFYNVPYYGSRNLREHIFDGHLDSDSACSFLESLLDWMFDNVYSRKISDGTSGWVHEKHIKRVLSRLPECTEKCLELGKIIAAERIVINGITYRNVRELYVRLSEMDNFIEKIAPKDLVMIHGDLHFQNILLSSETDTGFVLVDPRGESLGSDIYYDLGKLWHSFHAKYDFIHSDQFRLKLSWEGGVPVAEYDITNKFAERVFDEIYDKFSKVITKFDFIGSDPDWEMKVLFAEASHLCSVSTFHIGKTKSPDRAIVLYLIGVKLINEFFDKYLGNT